MSDDLISRQEAIDFIKHEQCKNCSDIGLCGNCAVLVALRLLKKVPAVQPEQKIGEWVHGEFDIPHCSICGHDVMPNMVSPYCPNCGAKMEK